MIKRHASVSFNLSAVALAMMAVSSSNWAADMTFSPKRVTKEINQKTWVCKRCNSKVVSQGEVEVGAGVVSNDAYAFQNLVPADGDGAVAILSGQGKWVNNSGAITTVAAKDLGLKRFSVAAGYRSAASGGANISYQELPHYYSDLASTPYINVAQQASLPDDWQSGSTTGDMTNLDESLRNEKVESLRQRLIVNSDFLRSDSLRPELTVRLEKQTGQNISSGFVGGGATNWVTPVDQQTLVIDAGLSKLADNWLVGFAYSGSLYENDLSSMVWENPYSVSVPGTEYGQLSIAPDNQAHQLSLNGRYQQSSTQISGRFAYGLQIQDEDFDDYTVNTTLLTSDLPAQSADAKIQTINAAINASHRVNRQWRLTAKINVHDRDNQTDSYLFTPVLADSFIKSSEYNQAYSYRRQGASLTGYYNGWKRLPLKMGYEYKGFYRSLGEREDTYDNQLWLTLKSKHWQSFVTDAKLLAARRDGSDFTELADNQSDLLRRYNIADRDLLEARIGADWQVTDSVSSLIKVRYSVEDFDSTQVGLTARERFTADWDWNWQIGQQSSLYTGLGYQHLIYEQSGANSSGNPTWQGDLDDDSYSLLLGGDAKGVWLKSLDLGLDYVLSYATNQQNIDLSINNGTGYPENYYRNHTVNGWLSYQLSKASKFKFNMIYENVSDKDYYWSNTTPDSLSNVLTLGELSENYSTWYAGVSYLHSF